MFRSIGRGAPGALLLFLLAAFALLLGGAPPALGQKKHAAEEKGVRALKSDIPTSIEFLNRGQQPIKLYRLDEEGKRVFVAELKTGERRTEATFLTHPWLLTDEQDNALALHYPDAEKRLVAHG